MRAFLETLRKWLDAVERGDAFDARFQTEQVTAMGRLLSSDPEFDRLFHAYKNDCLLVNAEEALNCVHAFMHAAADAAVSGRFRAGN